MQVPTSTTGHGEEAQAAATGHEEAQVTATGQEKKSAATGDNEQAPRRPRLRPQVREEGTTNL